MRFDDPFRIDDVSTSAPPERPRSYFFRHRSFELDPRFTARQAWAGRPRALEAALPQVNDF
jgi:hypothetical protein